MTISTIVCNADIFRQFDEQDFSVSRFPLDSDIQDIKYDLSRQEIEYDLYRVFNLTSSTREAELNSKIALYENEFQTLLMLCQLKNYYFSNIQGSDERDNLRYKDFLTRYQKQLSFISDLFAKVGNKLKVGRISRV